MEPVIATIASLSSTMLMVFHMLSLYYKLLRRQAGAPSNRCDLIPVLLLTRSRDAEHRKPVLRYFILQMEITDRV